jgi:DNA-binding Lrp family transcriptional regulator
MAGLWKRIERLLNEGVSEEFALYLLPNAVSIRFEESGDLLNFHHKWTKRLCYTAQEEIWKTSQEEVFRFSRWRPGWHAIWGPLPIEGGLRHAPVLSGRGPVLRGGRVEEKSRRLRTNHLRVERICRK